MRQIKGTHLLIDGYVKNPDTLTPDNISDLFDLLVPALKMQYLQRPIALRVPIDKTKLDTEEDEGGWSVICQITTSHISLHSWPERRAFMMDIFSCCDFDTDIAKEIIFSKLGVEKFNCQIIDRTIGK